MKKNRFISFLIILISYIVSFVLGYISYINLPFNDYINLLIADIISTGIIFIFSLIFNNASIYDPYWSVFPVVLVIMLLITKELNAVRILMAIAIIGWGIRLTLNWAYTFKNLTEMDWRYVKIKEKTKFFYPIANLIGIQLMPTLIVYLCILPVMFVFNHDVTLNPFVIIFFTLSIFAFTMQGIADYEMHKFRKNKNGIYNRNGLWKYSRHPNYLGEIMMWWMVALMAIFALQGYYFLVIGATVNTALFLFISIPLAEKHQMERKPNFLEYKKETRMLLPIYKKSK